VPDEPPSAYTGMVAAAGGLQNTICRALFL